VPFGHSWPGADVELELVNHPGQWQGLGADGHGRLRARRTQVRVASRGAAHRGRKATVLLPGPTGALASTERSGLSARALTACDSVAGGRTQGWVEASPTRVPGVTILELPCAV
jgi:hypothetical protein